MGSILLALSTYRQSDTLIQETIKLAQKEDKHLIVAFIVDANLARYLIGSETTSKIVLRHKSEGKLLEHHTQEARKKVKDITALAAENAVKSEGIVRIGRFGIEVMKIIRARKPEKVILTKSRRPLWVLQLFGSPVDFIIENADCPVLEDYGISVNDKEREKIPKNWVRTLFSFRKSKEGIRWSIVSLTIALFLFLALTPAPKSLVHLVGEENPLGYRLQSGTYTITESVNKILKTDLTEEKVAYKAKMMVAILFTAALLWATESIPLGATDLLVGALLYLFFILPLDTISKAYMKDAVFFIFGVLAIAVGVAKTGLDRRIALLLLGKVKGLKSFCFVFLPMLALAAGFLSEHALIAILVPVLLRCYRMICDANNVRADRALAVFLLLGICFAANQGGPGSPAAGGRNAIMVGYLTDYGLPISFAQWMYYALPYVLLLSLCLGGYMYWRFRKKIKVKDVNFSEFVKKEAAEVSRMTRKEMIMAVILVMVVGLWITSSKNFGLGGPCVFGVFLMLLFNVINWKDIQSKVRFEVVGLYAAACAMGVGLKLTGAAIWLARCTLGLLPETLSQGNSVIVATSLLTSVMTNLMSDGATVAALGPIALSMADVASVHIWKIGLACAFASSFANILIIGTPNNAIAYTGGVDPQTGERLLTLRDFLVYGIPVTILSIVVLWVWTIFGYWQWMTWP